MKVRRTLETAVRPGNPWNAHCPVTGEVIEAAQLATILQFISRDLVRNPTHVWTIR